MKIRLPTLLLALLLLATPCYAGGIAPDKQKHIGVGAALNLGLQAAGVKKETAWCIAGAVFIGKELYDARHRDRHTPELADIVADIGGVVISEGVIWIVHKKF
jgi:hypothetical protein